MGDGPATAPARFRSTSVSRPSGGGADGLLSADFVAKVFIAPLIANFSSCRRGFRVNMRETSSPGDKRHPACRRAAKLNRLLCGIARSSWLAGFERQFLSSRDAFLRHRQDHRYSNVSARNRRQVNDLLLTEQLLGTRKRFVRNLVLGRQLIDEVIYDRFLLAACSTAACYS
jgi:hypothetical protein